MLEHEIYTPFLNCGWIAEDDTCCHPMNLTPECHQFCCPIEAVGLSATVSDITALMSEIQWHLGKESARDVWNTISKFYPGWDWSTDESKEVRGVNSL